MVSKNPNRYKTVADAFGDALERGSAAPEGFEILRELDRGGMAIVYLAQQLNPLREVALKVMLPRFIDDKDAKERFQLEGNTMAALEHARVLPIYQVGEWNGLCYMAMRLAQGGTLEDYLKRETPDAKQAVEWLIVVGEAVHFAHQRGVLHRDLKPGNLLFDDQGAIYVGDFGVAKVESARSIELTRTESLVGTPHYLAPEIASGSANGGSVATDIYALGAVLYECLTGKTPYDESDSLAELLRDVADNELPCVREVCPDVPCDLAVICGKALAKNPEDRYGSVLDLVENLRRCHGSVFP